MFSPRLQRLLVPVALAVAVLAVYAPLTRCEFINLDDAEYVKDNPNINGGISPTGIKWAFENTVTGNWHPLTMMSHMLDCQLYGLHAGGHHLTNLLFHLVNTLLLFWVLLAMTDKSESAGAGTSRTSSNLWPCALVAAFFGLHPLHVESVAWVSERKDVLSAFFFILMIGAYSRYATRVSREPWSWRAVIGQPWYLTSLFFFTLGLLSKPIVVTGPFVLLLLDYWPLRRSIISGANPQSALRSPHWGWLLLEKTPFFVLAAVFCVITFLTQKNSGAVVILQQLPWGPRLAGVLVSYVHYLAKTIWPQSLTMLYPWHHWPVWNVAGAAALLILVSLVVVWMARRQPHLLVGWLLFIGMLVPAIGVVQVGQTVMADHHTYLPLIGLFIIMAWSLSAFAVSPAKKIVATSLSLLAIGGFTAASVAQVRYWKDSETLFGHAVRVTDSNSVAHYILGAVLDSQGKPDEANFEFAAAVHDNPANAKAQCAMGHGWYAQGQYEAAVQSYLAALQIDPSMSKAHFGLAEVLTKQHQLDEAMAQYLAGLKLNPNVAPAHYQLAGLYSARGDVPSAISQLQEALRLDPDMVLALNNLAWIFATQPSPNFRNGEEAMRLAERAVLLTGKNNPFTLDTLAAAYAENGRFTDAVNTAQNAIQIASSAGQAELVTELEPRLKLYQAGQAFRE